MLGSLKELKQADQEVRDVLASVEAEIKGKLGGETFEVVSYKTQPVAGTNYFAKVKTSSGKFAHVRVYKNLEQAVSLHSVQSDKAEADDIVHF